MFKLQINSTYGEVILKLTKQLQNKKNQSASAKCRWIFLTKCIANHILPKSFRTRPVINTTKGKNINKSYNIQMLKLARNDAKQRYHVLLHEIQVITQKLQNELSTEDYNTVQRITEVSREYTFVKVSNQLKQKFQQLSSHLPYQQTKKQLVKSAVLNLTNHTIPAHQLDLLNLGPKFVPAIEHVPVLDIITSTEVAAARLVSENQTNTNLANVNVKAERLRSDVSKILTKYATKKLPSNLNQEQKRALREMKKEEEIKVVQFDKGVGFAVLTNEDMKTKVTAELGDAKVIEKDPTTTIVKKIQQEVSRLHKEEKIDRKVFYNMYPSDSVPPRLYGQVKAHKPAKNYPMRNVVSTVGTPFHGTSKYLVDIIQPTLNKNKIRVKNSTTFVDEAKQWIIEHDEIQVSYDVVALYPSIPVKKAIDATIKLLEHDLEDMRTRTKLTITDIRKLLELCLNKCYFLYNDNIHVIDDAGPIGLSLMVVLAEAYLQYIEEPVLQQAEIAGVCPKTYRRYVDDSHARFQTIEQARNFLEILNSQDPKIQYTMETEEKPGELAFLDVCIINNGTGKYRFKIHRKAAITNVQLKPTSSINPTTVDGVFKGFVSRALRICSPEHIEEEIKFLIDVFTENGHDPKKLQRIAQTYQNKLTQPDKPTENKDRPVVKLPWIPIVGPKLRAAYRRHGVSVIFSSGPSLKDLICKHKCKLPPNSTAGIYRVQCGCSKAYIGETKKRIMTRINEHQKDIFHGRWKNTGASEHAATCEQTFKWDQATTLAVEEDFRRRKVREAIEIRRHQRSEMTILNRDLGGMKSSQWDVLLGKLTSDIIAH